MLQDLETQSVKMPVMDNDTRWGSVAAMVDYGLQNREGIEVYYCKNMVFISQKIC